MHVGQILETIIHNFSQFTGMYFQTMKQPSLNDPFKQHKYGQHLRQTDFNMIPKHVGKPSPLTEFEIKKIQSKHTDPRVVHPENRNLAIKREKFGKKNLNKSPNKLVGSEAKTVHFGSRGIPHIIHQI